MKKIIFILFIAHTSLRITHAQWQADFNLSNDPGAQYTSFNNAWCVAASGNFVYAVWRDINGLGFFKRSTNGGVNWITQMQLGGSVPSVAASGSTVHVAWEDFRDGNYEIYYKRSTDAGITWGPDTRLSNTLSSSLRASVAVSGSVVIVVWNDATYVNGAVCYNRSTDGGSSWGMHQRITFPPARGGDPSITMSGALVNIAWTDNRTGNNEIYSQRSTDGGLTWQPDMPISTANGESRYPSIGSGGSNVHILWTDLRDGNEEIYYKRSSNGGLSWGNDIRLTNNIAVSANVSVAASGSHVHIVWQDNRDSTAGIWEIYYKLSTDEGLTWGEDTRLTNQFNESNLPSIAASGPSVHVVWWDTRDWGSGNNPEILYKRNPTGNAIGIININSEIPNEFSLSQNYPNPFNPTTKIKFDVAASNLTLSGAKGLITKLTIYDLLGREVATLVNEQLSPGTYEVDFDGNNFSSGIYYYTLQTEGYTETRKMVLMK